MSIDDSYGIKRSGLLLNTLFFLFLYSTFILLDRRLSDAARQLTDTLTHNTAQKRRRRRKKSERDLCLQLLPHTRKKCFCEPYRRSLLDARYVTGSRSSRYASFLWFSVFELFELGRHDFNEARNTPIKLTCHIVSLCLCMCVRLRVRQHQTKTICLCTSVWRVSGTPEGECLKTSQFVLKKNSTSCFVAEKTKATAVYFKYNIKKIYFKLQINNNVTEFYWYQLTTELNANFLHVQSQIN